MKRNSLLLLCVLMLAPIPVFAQLEGTDTAPGESCTGFPAGATRVTADADQDGRSITLICDGTTWEGVASSFSGNCQDGDFILFNSSNDGMRCADLTAPSGYVITWISDPIDLSNMTAGSFEIANAELGSDYSYTVSSDGGGTNVTGAGSISGTTEIISDLDFSGLFDGTLTLSVVLTDAAGNVGANATATVVKLANPCSGSPAPGTICGDGSIYAGLSPDGNIKMYTTPADSSIAAYWGTHSFATGSTSNVTGEANTSDIYAHVIAGDGTYNPNDGFSPNAAVICQELIAHGKSDWFLPARNELSVLYLNRVAIGGWAGADYWSSSEAGLYGAWRKNMSSGSESDLGKSNTSAVRCVRT